ncbi:MAG: hypothetical protein ABSG89_12215 [Bacteroidales bacterium]|jgi:hypothetical protein
MKKLLFNSLVFIVLIITAIFASSCSNKKTRFKEDKVEMRLHLSNAVPTELIKPPARNIIVHYKGSLTVDTLVKKLAKVNHRLKNDWFRGQNRPYKKILVALNKQGYNLTNYLDKGPDRKELFIQLANEWNLEDVNNIKNIIMNALFFEPRVCTSRLPDGKDVITMIWTGSKYNAYVFQSGFDGMIHLSFETK